MYSMWVCYLVFLLPVLEAEPIKCLRLNEQMKREIPDSLCVDGDIQNSAIVPDKMQCVCKPGFYRNYLGECLPEEYCGRCKGNNEFFACGPECDNECSTLLEMNRTNCPIVNIVCNDRCYCEDGYARNDEGYCIPVEECPPHNRFTRNTNSHHHESLCPHNEEHTARKKSCPPDTCISLVARFKCDSKEKCTSGCYCKSGYLRKNPNGPCVPIRECPELALSSDFL